MPQVPLPPPYPPSAPKCPVLNTLVWEIHLPKLKDTATTAKTLGLVKLFKGTPLHDALTKAEEYVAQ